MRYRVCKSFEVESGHMLSKHPGRCRHPHGHSRRVDVVISAESLDANDMVCDFKAIKLAVSGFIDRFDHAMMINSADPALPRLQAEMTGERLIVVENEDPTTEVMARIIFEHVRNQLASDTNKANTESGFGFSTGLLLERIRVTETSSSWAEYGI